MSIHTSMFILHNSKRQIYSLKECIAFDYSIQLMADYLHSKLEINPSVIHNFGEQFKGNMHIMHSYL